MRPLCGPGDAACHTTCPPGWEFDSLLFYLSSCNSPAGLFVGVTSVALVLCIAACALSLLRFVTAKGATKRVILYFGLSALCLVVAFSEALARGFMDNYFWVPFGGFMIFIGAGYLQFLSLFFKVCYSQIGQKMSAQKHVIMRSLLWCSGLSLALPIGIVFPSYFLSLGPWSSPQFPVNEYNLAVCVLFISVPIHLLAAFPCGLVVTSDLESHIRSAANVPNQSDSRKLREVHRRVWLFRVLNVGLFSFSETFFCGALLLRPPYMQC
jgi:hypothetical protein